MNVEQLEEEARKSAVKHVANMLQRPDQLEKVEQYKRRVTRKKASVEAMLKTAVQSQLDGVRSGLQQLQSALKDLSDIRSQLHEIEEAITPLPNLCESVNKAREEHVIHSQYAVAMENLKHIFTVPESVEKTRLWISEGKLLHAHQSLTDLENSRDDLLYELHRLPSHSAQDRHMLKAYFSGVEQLSGQLGKQLWLILKRVLNTVRKEPQVVVTAVRIIEREELADAYAVQRQKQSGFLPPARPKKWKARAIEVLGDAVRERIEGNQFEDRSDNKMWLVRHFEVIRMLIIEDLHVVKTLCPPCFPPDWDIFNQFVQLYHEALSSHLEEVIDARLEANEFVTVLSWVLRTYPGPELLQHKDLRIDPKALGSLLRDETIESLIKSYLDNMTRNYSDWMQKALEREARDWRRRVEPESDNDGHYHTEATVIIFQMVEQNLQVSKTVSDDLMMRALNLGLEQIIQYGLLYRDAIILFKSKHFEDRSLVLYFTHYMIAIVNNCFHIMELAKQMRTRYLNTGENKQIANSFESLLMTYEHLRDEAAGFLLEEAFLDLEPSFQELISRKWVSSPAPIDTVETTIADYLEDYSHLKPENFNHFVHEAELCIARKYISAIFQRKLSFKTAEERRDAAEKMCREAKQIAKLFLPGSPSSGPDSKSAAIANDAIISLAEIVRSDLEMVSLELHGLVKKYPDFSQDQLSCLLSLRGDVGRLDLKQMASDLLADCTKDKTSQTTIFSQIPVSVTIF
uniref:EOG090X03GO n=1 Tax=Evadne anonyx TaxID=141404 RepID=A0A9N6ZEW6_9CRUS|nr:EOG090X03GO [Evadne anonyx]